MPHNDCRILYNYVLALILLYLFGCTSSVNDTTAPTTQTTESARVRFIHSASSTSELDFAYRDLSDNNYYILQDNTVYGHQYGYYDLITGTRQIRVYFSDSQIAVTAGTITLEKDKKYSLVAYDFEATINPELMALNDTTAIPDSGYAYVRFIHLATDVDQIRIGETGNDSPVTILDKHEDSKYFTRTAQTYHFQAAVPGSAEILLENIPVTFLSRQVYTIIFSGSLTGITSVNFNALIYRETGI